MSDRDDEFQEIKAALRGDMSDHEERISALESREAAEMKEAVREAIKEWLDEKFAAFGKWSLMGIAAAALAAFAYALLLLKGWKPPQ